VSQVSTRNLGKYLKLVKNLEVSVYEQQMVLSSLNRQIVNTYSQKEFAQKKAHDSFVGWLFLCCFWSVTVLVVVGAVIAFCLDYHAGDVIGAIIGLFFPNSEDTLFASVWKGIKIGFFVGIAIGVSVAIIFWIRDVRDVKRANKKVEQYNAEVERENYANIQAIAAKNEFLNEEMKIIKRNLDRTNKILANVYALDVIHAKYRYNMVYICSIYEYFDTGRCDRLEGHEGAYNLLEADIKYNNIIDKLDVIITKLDDIRDSQRELYIAIQNTNKNIQQVNSSIYQLLGNMSNMEEGLNQIEYNSRVSRQNGEFLKWYAYFRG